MLRIAAFTFGRLLLILVAIAALAGGKPLSAAEPDPSLEAQQKAIEREVNAARSAVEASTGTRGTPSPAMNSPGMSAPSMSNPGMPAPGVPAIRNMAPPARSVTQSSGAASKRSPKPEPVVTGSAAAFGKPKIWSFQPIVNPPLPGVRDAAWCRTDIDPFIAARREAKNLAPNPDADPVTYIRRVTFDLTGLPPTRDEVEAFLRDYSPPLSPPTSPPTSNAASAENPADRQRQEKAYEALVDRLLASPRFGERWARHWLDVVHYADSIGQIWNAPFNYAFRYRNWTIDALNADKPYDRFIVEQLAGDLLPADDVETQRNLIIATGMLALGSLDLVDGQVEQFFLDRVDDQIDVTTRAFLGVTVSCARCHDHKYDPVTMRDYYALAGVFYSSLTLPGTAEPLDRRNGYVDPQMLAALPTAPGSKASTLKSLSGVTPTLGPGIHSMNDMQDEWRNGAGYRDLRWTTDPDLAMAVTEGEPRDCELRLKGDAYDRGEAPPRGDVRIAGLPPIPPISPDDSGRLELAHWIASDKNPLTARVAVNRIWQHLFGKGLVRSVDDFGSTGEPPTHPELLDHLAARFMADGWSVKRQIRRIVLSRTYRQSSNGTPTAEAIDAPNDLYWRADMRRLELEPLRDAMLSVAGRLTFDRPTEIQMAGNGGKGKWGGTRSLTPIDSSYRTIYLPVLRSLLPPLYTTFDFPDPAQIQGRREVTTVAPQALFMLNSNFADDCSADAASALFEASKQSDVERIAAAYWRVLSRAPTADETADALTLVNDLRPGNVRNDEQYRWSVLVQALMGSAEFRYVK
jgi:hypothetical protein